MQEQSQRYIPTIKNGDSAEGFFEESPVIVSEQREGDMLKSIFFDSMEVAFHCHDASKARASKSELMNRRAQITLWISVVICLFFMICEVIGGLWAGSLAIITDAAHLLTDLASMLISLFSLYLSARPASQRMSFGWHRAEVIGAFISVFLIWIVTGILVFLAIQRMILGEYEIDAIVMSITSLIGLCVNLVMGAVLYFGGVHTHSHTHTGSTGIEVNHRPTYSSENEDNESIPSVRFQNDGGEGGIVENELLLPTESKGESRKNPGHGHKRHSHSNINVRAALIHVFGDFIQSFGVFIASLLILWNKKLAIADPICTLLFSIIVLSTTIYIVRDALVVLLEGRPSNIDFRHVFDSLENIQGVKKVHDLRIWALTIQKIAISVHLEIDPQSDSQRVLRATTVMLRSDFNAHETTVQIEDYQPKNCFQCVVPQE